MGSNAAVILDEDVQIPEAAPDDEIAQAWAEEAVRRDEAMERGEEPGIPAEDVFRKLRIR